MAQLAKQVIGPILHLKPVWARFKKAEAEGAAWYFFQLYLRRQAPIIIYQMGKVGSDSISKSLLNQGLGPIYHIHYLYPQNRQVIQDDLKRRNQPLAGREAMINLYKYVIKKGKPAKFITLAREPIARNISAFFQNFPIFTGTKYEDAHFSTEELIETFMREYPHDVPVTWFDKELKQTLGIDIYQYPFPKEVGHLSIRNKNFELLIIKTETDDQAKEKAIAGFLGLDKFKLVRTNVSQDKEYASAYQNFVRAIALPQNYIDTMCNAKYTRHFYSEAEIEAIRGKWQRSAQVSDA